jgi:hypothetical protein
MIFDRRHLSSDPHGLVFGDERIGRVGYTMWWRSDFAAMKRFPPRAYSRPPHFQPQLHLRQDLERRRQAVALSSSGTSKHHHILAVCRSAPITASIAIR